MQKCSLGRTPCKPGWEGWSHAASAAAFHHLASTNPQPCCYLSTLKKPGQIDFKYFGTNFFFSFGTNFYDDLLNTPMLSPSHAKQSLMHSSLSVLCSGWLFHSRLFIYELVAPPVTIGIIPDLWVFRSWGFMKWKIWATTDPIREVIPRHKEIEMKASM